MRNQFEAENDIARIKREMAEYEFMNPQYEKEKMGFMTKLVGWFAGKYGDSGKTEVGERNK